VETAQDIVDQLAGLLSFKHQEIKRFSSPQQKLFTDSDAKQEMVPTLCEQEQRLMQSLGYDPLPIDVLAERMGVDIGSLSAQLIGLEIKGLVQQIGACYQRTES
jgi:DNA processing protein